MEAVFWAAVMVGIITAGFGTWLGISYRRMLKEQEADNA